MFKKIFNKNIFRVIIFWFIIFIIIVFIVLFIHRDKINLWHINWTHARQGYYICQGFDCTRKNLITCNKSFFRIEFKDKFIEEYVYDENNLCVFKMIKSDKTGMECHFYKHTLDMNTAYKILISNYNYIPEVRNNCQIINIP